MENIEKNRAGVENINEGSNVIERGTGVLERLIDIVNNNRFTKIIKAFGVYVVLLVGILLGIFVIRFSLDPVKYIDKITEAYHQQRELEHKELVDKRMEAEPTIRADIKQARLEIDADRAFIFEYHNSVKSLNGIPFIYADMRYEDCWDSIDEVDYDYQSQPTSRYPMSSYLLQKRCYFGTTEEIAELDDRLSKKLEADGVKYIALVCLEGGSEEIGFLGFSFIDRVPSEEELEDIRRVTHRYSVKLSVLLNNKL